MSKSPCLLLPSYGTIFGSYASYSNSILTLPNNSIRRGSKRKDLENVSLGWQTMQCRRYAHLRSEKPPADRFDEFGWPKLSITTAIPTPYQIFQQENNAPYSKWRFYELVKLYHPDRCSHEHGLSKSLSSSTRVERYRLVIAANIILSDPAKRKAYDKFGTGWDGRPDCRIFKQTQDHDENTDWTGFAKNESPARNATWEDWERWYQRDGRSKQETVYFSNGAFFSVVVILVVLGGIGQATTVRGFANTYLKQIEAANHECTTAVHRRRVASHGFGNKGEQVDNFLRARDPYSLKNEQSRECLPPPSPFPNDEQLD